MATPALRGHVQAENGTCVTRALREQPAPAGANGARLPYSLWVETSEKRLGPYILHERSDGEYGQTLADSVYLQRAVVSRRAMDQARKSAETQPASAPAPPTDTR